MAYHDKAFAARLDLSLISGFHMMGEESQFLQVVLSPPQVHCGITAQTHQHTNTPLLFCNHNYFVGFCSVSVCGSQRTP